MLLSFLAVTVTYRSPVTRLEEWDEIAETLARSFGAPGTRPFYIDPGSELGRKVADLFRIKLERAQAVQTPSQRRLPQDVPFTARGAFLVHNDGTKTIELEDLSLVHQPKQRFAKPVRYGLLVYGHLIPEEESQKTAEHLRLADRCFVPRPLEPGAGGSSAVYRQSPHQHGAPHSRGADSDGQRGRDAELNVHRGDPQARVRYLLPAERTSSTTTRSFNDNGHSVRRPG